MSIKFRYLRPIVLWRLFILISQRSTSEFSISKPFKILLTSLASREGCLKFRYIRFGYKTIGDHSFKSFTYLLIVINIAETFRFDITTKHEWIFNIKTVLNIVVFVCEGCKNLGFVLLPSKWWSQLRIIHILILSLSMCKL